MKQHTIRIDEPWSFEHPNGTHSFECEAVGMIKGPDLINWQKRSYLLNVLEPFKFDGEEVKQIFCTPRYQGDTLFSVKNTTCIVGISRVKPGTTMQEGDVIEPEKTHYFAIGGISSHNKLLQRIKKSCAFFSR